MTHEDPGSALVHLREPESEYGTGIVVCLAKFSEHLGNEQATRIGRAIWWLKQTPEKRAYTEAEYRKYPNGDSAEFVRAAASLKIYSGMEGNDEARGLSQMIMQWMNGASDHFYGLDETKAPQPLRELAALTLRIGHGYTGETWTQNTTEEIHRLWQESCLAVDRMFGVEKSDWGRW